MAKKASSRKKATGKGKPAGRKKPAKAAKKSKKASRGAKAARKPARKSKPTPRKAKSARKTTAEPPAKPAKKAAKRPSRRTAKVKSPLTRPQLRRFRQMLLDKRRELVGDMTGIEAEAFGADRQEVKGDISDHPADAGTDNFEQEFSLGLLESERTMLAEIDEALRRIDDGTYGICLGTGKPIGRARLKARPWAKYCIEYARMIEKGLVRPGERIDEDETD